MALTISALLVLVIIGLVVVKLSQDSGTNPRPACRPAPRQ